MSGWITLNCKHNYRAIILKLPCSVRWVILIIMYPDVWHTYLHLLPKISRRKVIYIYYISQRWMVWVRVKSCQASIQWPVSLLWESHPTFPCISHFTFNQPIEKTWFHYVPLHIYIYINSYYILHCAPIKSPLYRHVCFIPHVLQFRTFFLDQNIFSAWNHTFWWLLGGGYHMF